MLDHLFNVYDGPGGENPKEKKLNENKSTAAGYIIRFQDSGPFRPKQTKAGSKSGSKLCPYPLGTAQQIIASITAVLSRTHLDIPCSKRASYR